VTAFGIFVALDTVYIEGLVHVSELGEDYFQFDNIKHQMLGERTGQAFPPRRPGAGQAGACRSGNQQGSTSW
jgi:exoribonuclease R